MSGPINLTLYALRVFARDWQECVDFYEQVLELPLRFRDDDLGWAEFDVGGPSLAVERLQPDDDDAEVLSGRFVGASLRTKDIQATYQVLHDRGVEFVGPPTQQSWGGVLAHFKDPEGNVLTLLGEP